MALLGDGSAMYSIQALWTAAHHKLSMTFVVFNNGGYRIIKQRLKLVLPVRPQRTGYEMSEYRQPKHRRN